jgi:hypothetical protein
MKVYRPVTNSLTHYILRYPTRGTQNILYGRIYDLRVEGALCWQQGIIIVCSNEVFVRAVLAATEVCLCSEGQY